MLEQATAAGAPADTSNVPTTPTHVPLLAATVVTNCITVRTTPPALVTNVVPIPRKRVAEIPAVTLVAHAAMTTAAVNPASSAAMILPEDAVLPVLRASQKLTNVTLEAQVVAVELGAEVEVEAVELASRLLLLLPSQLCYQEPLLPAVV